MKSINEPVSLKDRAQSLDVLRGVAVLGILAMNIRLFGMPQAAYFNPQAYGDLTGINQLWFWFTNLFADQKFMTLFSMMFGAGIALMSERCAAKGLPSTGLLLRRNFWLLVLGLMHAYLIWFGDILVAYALAGFVLMFCRNWKPLTQLITGLLFLCVPSALFLTAGMTWELWPPEEQAAALVDWAPGAEVLAKELATYRGGWMEQLSHRIPTAIEFQTVVFAFFGFWRAGGLMLIGMALFSWGYFTAERSPASFRRLALVCIVLALPAIALGIVMNEQSGWAYAEAFFIHGQLNYWGSFILALGYLGLVMLWCLGDRGPKLKARFAAVGRMAFSNYIAQSLICTLIFYGHGLGAFGHLERWQLALIVFGVWALQLWWSPWWLARYRFGPMEWLWRCLSYWRVQPFRRPAPATP
ncbi:MAG: DUF418 domain-containing protein [Pseudomonadota bacterium]